MGSDLHRAFGAPDAAPLDDRAAFLHEADRLPAFVEIRASMLRLAPPPDGGVLADVGCGLGLEVERLAAAHPGVTVIGLDHDGEAIEAARARTTAANLQWRRSEFTALDLRPGSVDVLRTERVLIYATDLSAALGSISSVLRTGGVLVSFELDYGGTVLPALGHSPDWVRRLGACLEDALPQPWAGRLLPETCAEHGLDVVTVEPHSFLLTPAMWSRIVAGTLRNARDEGRLDAPGLDEWIADLEPPDSPHFRGTFTGLLTVAVRT